MHTKIEKTNIKKSQYSKEQVSSFKSNKTDKATKLALFCLGRNGDNREQEGKDPK